MLIGALRPGEARAADQPAIHPHRVRPVERDGQLGRSVHRQRIGQRSEAGIKRAAGGLERFVRLQHQREFHKVEATHVDERPRPFFGRHVGRVREGVAHLAQCHEPKRRRQVECRFG